MKRIEFIKKSISLISLGFFSQFLLGCGNDGKGSKLAADACNDISGLNENDLKQRESLGYIAATKNPEQNCLNCRFYVKPSGNDACGGCQLFKGKVHPNGWCKSWVVVEA